MNHRTGKDHKREQLKGIAKQTLEILEKGTYRSPRGRLVNIEQEVGQSIEKTILYTPSESDSLLASLQPNDSYQTVIEVTNESTLVAAKRLAAEGFEQVTALNFASAKNPGGGFLKGSSAQEESLARSSGLYASLSLQKEMYEENTKNNHQSLYSDYLIYSPYVPVFRQDNGTLLDQPFSVSFLTCPAVNKGAIQKNARQVDQKKIDRVMQTRIEKILAVGIEQGCDALVLGAYGCGVFGNEPADVARYFKQALEHPHYRNQYKKVTFAILDFSKEKTTLRPFQNAFNPS